jgi:hypothetical protein
VSEETRCRSFALVLGTLVAAAAYFLYTRKMHQQSADRPTATGGSMGAPGAMRAWPFVLGRPLVFYLFSLLVAVCAALMLRGIHPGKLIDLTNLMGPLAESVAHGRGYMVCTDAMTVAGNVLCSHASRMPLPPLLLAALIRIFHDNSLAVELTKIALVLLPVAAAVKLVDNDLRTASRPLVRVLAPALLFISLILPIQMIDVINMQVEEGYSF